MAFFKRNPDEADAEDGATPDADAEVVDETMPTVNVPDWLDGPTAEPPQPRRRRSRRRRRGQDWDPWAEDGSDGDEADGEDDVESDAGDDLLGEPLTARSAAPPPPRWDDHRGPSAALDEWDRLAETTEAEVPLDPGPVLPPPPRVSHDESPDDPSGEAARAHTDSGARPTVDWDALPTPAESTALGWSEGPANVWDDLPVGEPPADAAPVDPPPPVDADLPRDGTASSGGWDDPGPPLASMSSWGSGDDEDDNDSATDEAAEGDTDDSMSGVLPALIEDGPLSAHLLGLKNRARDELSARLGARLYDREIREDQLESLIIEELGRFLYDEEVILDEEDQERLAEELINDVLRHGPIEAFLQDPTVTEIMINSTDAIYIERGGRLYITEARFTAESHLRQVIERIAGSIGRRIDESSPMVDARLADGSRVNAIIPPLAVDGSAMTIRKFGEDRMTVDDLLEMGSMTPQVGAFLAACVRGRMNILVSGGTGSGKTTMLNVLSSYIPASERIITIEDAVELQMHQRHVIRLESRPANVEGKGRIEIRDLVRNALRMRPDRIVIGEVRGGEALDMLQAMNTGHDGSLSTLHANSPRDALRRAETMVLMAGVDLPLKFVREQVASAVDMIVHLARLRDGSRRITHISEVSGMETDVITLNDIFRFDFTSGVGADGRFLGETVPTGVRPGFLERLEDQGINVPASIFSPEGDDAARNPLVSVALLGIDLDNFQGHGWETGGRIALLAALIVAAVVVVRPADDSSAPGPDNKMADSESYLRIGLANTVRIGVAVAGVVGFLFMDLLGAAVFMAVGIVLYTSWLNRADSRRRTAFEEQLPETLQLIAGSMRSGLSLLQSIDTVSLEAPWPTNEEFQRVLYENRLGRDLSESLRALSERMDSSDFSWVVGAIEIHREVGGDLAEVLDRVGNTVRSRNRVRAQVKALSAEGRLSGVVLSALPPLMFIALGMLNPEYVQVLTSRLAGWVLIGVAATLLLTGTVWLQRMAKFKF